MLNKTQYATSLTADALWILLNTSIFGKLLCLFLSLDSYWKYFKSLFYKKPRMSLNKVSSIKIWAVEPWKMFENLNKF